MGTLKRDENGFYYLSETGVEYSLYEGGCLGANASSDILYVMFDRYTEFPVEMVTFMYGADEIYSEDSDAKSYILKSIDEAVIQFEKRFRNKDEYVRFDVIERDLADVLDEISKDTTKFLDDEGEIADLTVTYKGKKASFPLDFAEINNETQGFIEELIRIMKEDY